jgi:hypothetical protein
MSKWFDEVAGDWPVPEGAWVFEEDVYDDLADAWRYASPELKVWLAARLAPGWPERIRLLGATARAVTVNLDVLKRWFEYPLDAVPDVAGLLSGAAALDDLPALEEAWKTLTHLATLEDVLASQAALAEAWVRLADPARRSEDAWRETATFLYDALGEAYMAFRALGPFTMRQAAEEAITSEVDWVA